MLDSDTPSAVHLGEVADVAMGRGGERPSLPDSIAATS